MRVVKAVEQTYTPNQDLVGLLHQFRGMLNDSIRIGLAENLTGMKSLSLKTYKQLNHYETPSCYKLCAISKAAGILSNYRKMKRKREHVNEPFARRLQLVTCYRFKIKNGELLLPLQRGKHVSIRMNHHTISVLAQPGLTLRSVTVTEKIVSIAYAKESVLIQPQGLIGIDRNVDNVTLVSSDGATEVHNLARASEVTSMYRDIKSHLTRNDSRIRRRIFTEYGRRQKNRVGGVLHPTSKQIVEEAKRKQFAIAMEKLTGLGKLYRKGNGQGREFRGRMAAWSYAALQRQVEYKAQWEGIPVIYVKPHGTSSKCSICGSRMARIPKENRMLKCHSCRFTVDRDVNAARNILARGMRAVRFAAVAPAGEAMVAVKRCQVDAGELTSRHPPTS